MLTVGAFLLAAHWGSIPVTDPRIAYVGRFTQEADSRACQWSASEVRVRIKGQTLVAQIDETGNDRWQVVVDGQTKEVLAPTAGAGSYTIDAGSVGDHEIRLVKRTEAFIGTTRFTGFDVPNGSLQGTRARKRHIEFVGDSITCGYGNEGSSKGEEFKPETENAYLSYASVAARAVGADVDVIAWSGRKMWPDNNMPDIYDTILPTVQNSPYDFKGPSPDAVIINLATNDFGAGNPDEAKWTGAYEAFIRRVWGHYPKARVYVAIGSMMSDNWPPKNKALTTLRGYLQHMVERVNDPRLGMIEFDIQKEEDGIGAAWHPSVRTHQKMADKLAERLRTDLHW